MRMPTFIGIGAQKCASTWLYEILRDHPQVVLSEPKELDFFSYRYHYGQQWYGRHFSARSEASAMGEISILCTINRQVYQFLGIDRDHQGADLHQRSNKSYVNRHAGLESLRQQAKETMQRLGLGPLWRLAANTGMKRIYARVNRLPSEAVIPPVAADTLRELRSRFGAEVRELERLLERELPGWH